MNANQRLQALKWFVNSLMSDDCDLEAIYTSESSIYLRLWLNGGARIIGYDIFGENIFSYPYEDLSRGDLEDLESCCVFEGFEDIKSLLDLNVDIHN